MNCARINNGFRRARPGCGRSPRHCRGACPPRPWQVHLCGSFTRWVETVPMTPVEGQPGTFTVVVHLPPG